MQSLGRRVWQGASGTKYVFTRYALEGATAWRAAPGVVVVAAPAEGGAEALEVGETANVAAWMVARGMSATLQGGHPAAKELHVDWSATGKAGRAKQADDLRRRHLPR